MLDESGTGMGGQDVPLYMHKQIGETSPANETTSRLFVWKNGFPDTQKTAQTTALKPPPGGLKVARPQFELSQNPYSEE